MRKKNGRKKMVRGIFWMTVSTLFILTMCGFTMADRALYKGPDQKSCSILEDEEYLYFCGKYRIVRMDKSTKETTMLWQSEESAGANTMDQFDAGGALLVGDRIYFLESYHAQPWEEAGMALSVVRTNGRGYERVAQLEGYYAVSMLLQDGLLYLNGNGLCYQVYEDGTLSEAMDRQELASYQKLTEQYKELNYSENGERCLMLPESLKNWGWYLLWDTESSEYVKVHAETEKAESLGGGWAFGGYNSQYFVIYYYEDGQHYELMDITTLEKSALIQIDSPRYTKVIAMDEEFLYLSRTDYEKNCLTYEKISLTDGSETVLLEQQGVQEYMAPVIHDGYLYFVSHRGEQLYLARCTLDGKGKEETLGDAFYDSYVSMVGTRKSYSEKFCSQTVPDTVLSQVDVEWLQVDDRFPGAADINQYMEEYVNSCVDYEKENAQWLEECVSEEWYSVYSYSSSFSNISYLDQRYFSFCQSEYDYAGGAHGMPYREGFTFDLETGERLRLSDVVWNNESQIKKIVKTYFSMMIEADPELYWENAVEYVEKHTDLDAPFYLTEEGICFWFGPYELACYAAGFQEVVIPYEEFWLKIDLEGHEETVYWAASFSMCENIV